MVLPLILIAVSSLLLSLIVCGVGYMDIHRRLLSIIEQVFSGEKTIKGLAFDAELASRSYKELNGKMDDVEKAIEHLNEDILKVNRKLETAIEEYDNRYRKVRASLGAKKRYEPDEPEEHNHHDITEVIDSLTTQGPAHAVSGRKFGELPY